MTHRQNGNMSKVHFQLNSKISEYKNENASSKDLMRGNKDSAIISVWRNLMHLSETKLTQSSICTIQARHRYTGCTAHFVDFISELGSLILNSSDGIAFIITSRQVWIWQPLHAKEIKIHSSKQTKLPQTFLVFGKGYLQNLFRCFMSCIYRSVHVLPCYLACLCHTGRDTQIHNCR